MENAAAQTPGVQPLGGIARELLALWAKWGRGKDTTAYHPLICHMVDVSNVTLAMWREVLPQAARRTFAAALGIPEDSASAWLAFFAGLHDIGKAAPVFQCLVPAAKRQLDAAEFRIQLAPGAAKHGHGTVTVSALRELLPEYGMSAERSEQVAMAVGGHHGVFPTGAKVEALTRSVVGAGNWRRARGDLARILATGLGIPTLPAPAGLENASAMALAGLVSVADWLGSDEHYFPYAFADGVAARTFDLKAYRRRSGQQATEALRFLCWSGWRPEAGPANFQRLFPDIPAPRPLQQAAIDVAAKLRGPALVVVEAPMGEGKTEAAFYLADYWGATLGQRGCYVALPTQATSNQMFDRFRAFLARRYPEEVVNLQLLHGHAALSAAFQQLRLDGDRLFRPQDVYGEAGGDGASAGVVAAEWFTGRKRGLLASFGVGTVDQALMAALQVRHVFVRLFGLFAKTVIIDEVHAYDTYMTSLLARLLEWLGALGASVVLLSATLPRKRRDNLLAAYARGARWAAASVAEAPYPRVTALAEAVSESRHVETSDAGRKRTRLTWVDGTLPTVPGAPFPLGERLQRALAGGGCAAVICNTVARAQQVYRALRPYFPEIADDGEPELDLLHARYLFEEREEREQRVLRRFGKPGLPGEAMARPGRAVLVATQVIEQSLDLDFDCMVSDTAPADLLLQRAGRLWRHDRPRPPRIAGPDLWLCLPTIGGDGVPRFDAGTEAVYDKHALLRTWLELRDRAALNIPSDVQDLIEAVYDNRECPSHFGGVARNRWVETKRLHDDVEAMEHAEAQRRYIHAPEFAGSLDRLVGTPREEEAPELHPEHQALTRLIEQAAQVVFLYGTEDQPRWAKQEREPVPINRTPDGGLAERLLRRSVSIGDRRIVQSLLGQEAPAAWRRSALLRHHRLRVLDDADGTDVGGYRLTLDAELGVVVSANEGK